MRYLYLFLLAFLCSNASAQFGIKETPSNSLFLTGGRSFHGTGDMKGISEKFTFSHYFTKKIFWLVSLGADIHDGKYQSSFTEVNGKVLDHSFRYTAGGVQLSGGLGVNFFRQRKYEIGLRLNGLVRYQSSSYFDQLFIVYDPQNIGPYPAVFIFNTSPQRTFSVGVSPEAYYNQPITRKLFLGISTGFQVDTNGDLLKNVSLSVGYRLN